MKIANIFSQTLVFFLLIDPIGNLPIFISILKSLPTKRVNLVIFRELLIALFVIIGFYFIGEWLMDFLHIANYTLNISGGIIIFLISLKMVFSDLEAPELRRSTVEPFIVPLAIPLIAGPAILAVVMIGAQSNPNHAETILSICIAWAASTLILLSSQFLQKKLGKKGLFACERLMGLILVLLSAQMFLNGIKQFANVCLG